MGRLPECLRLFLLLRCDTPLFIDDLAAKLRHHPEFILFTQGRDAADSKSSILVGNVTRNLSSHFYKVRITRYALHFRALIFCRIKTNSFGVLSESKSLGFFPTMPRLLFKACFPCTTGRLGHKGRMVEGCCVSIQCRRRGESG